MFILCYLMYHSLTSGWVSLAFGTTRVSASGPIDKLSPVHTSLWNKPNSTKTKRNLTHTSILSGFIIHRTVSIQKTCTHVKHSSLAHLEYNPCVWSCFSCCFLYSPVERIPTADSRNLRNTNCEPQQCYRSVLYNKALVLLIPFNLATFVQRHWCITAGHLGASEALWV